MLIFHVQDEIEFNQSKSYKNVNNTVACNDQNMAKNVLFFSLFLSLWFFF